LLFTPKSLYTFSGSRPGSLPPQPLRSANHLPESEAETLHFPKIPSAAVPRPNCLPPSKGFVDL
ncbi:hypothetical protein ANCCAN_28359, partial [Ancylostoma caninum]